MNGFVPQMQQAMTSGPRIISQTGATRAGSPLAMSRAPAEDLRPWFHWWSVSEGQTPEGMRIECGRFSDHSCLMFIFRDPWTATTGDGVQVWDPGETGRALYFGPHTRVMPLSFAGHYIAISLHFNAGATQALGFPHPSAMLDRIVDLQDLVEHDGPIAGLVDLSRDYAHWLTTLEDRLLRPLVAARKARVPDPLILAFERHCLANPDFTVEEFATAQGVSTRTVERAVKAHYGIAPKQALRRARALDMGAALLEVARPEELPEIEERYFDQSHRIRELRKFYGMVPSDLKNRPCPLLRLGLEVRQRRRLDALEALRAQDPAPWRDPASEPRVGDGG